MAVDVSKKIMTISFVTSGMNKWDEMGGVISGTCQTNCDEYLNHKASNTSIKH
jgi:hypothetical protein